VQQLPALPLSSLPLATHAQTPPSADPVQQLLGLPLSVPFITHVHCPLCESPEQQWLAAPLSAIPTGAHAHVVPDA